MKKTDSGVYEIRNARELGKGGTPYQKFGLCACIDCGKQRLEADIIAIRSEKCLIK